MKTIKAIALPALLWALLIPTAALAQPVDEPWGDGPGFGRPDFGRGPLSGRLAQKLELSEEQKTQIEAMHGEHRDEIEPLVAEVREARQSVGDLMMSEAFDEEALRAAAQLAADVHVELTVIRARHRNELKSVLTAEQLERLAELRDERRERRPDVRDRPGFRGRRPFGRRPDGRPGRGFGSGLGNW